MTKPNHNWVLLHLMFWAYIVLIFPGCYLLGKKWSDFRVVYAGLLGTVGLFSLMFSYVGQRGYGEATTVHTVAFASPLPDGQMDVSSWSNIFVTGGADYELRHQGFGSLYSTCNETEQVKGLINNGAEALFKVDIPPFSNRELAARTKIPVAGPQLKISRGSTQQTRIECGGVKACRRRKTVFIDWQFVLSLAMARSKTGVVESDWKCPGGAASSAEVQSRSLWIWGRIPVQLWE